MPVSVTESTLAPSTNPNGVVEQSTISSKPGDGISLQVTIRQDPLSITLDGSAIVILAFSLIVGLHLLQPPTVVGLIAVVPILLYIHNDFLNFLKLGPGGTPSTFEGYLWINWFKLWALRDPLEPLEPEADIVPSKGILSRNPLPYRCGPRPTVVGIAPQRQINQFSAPEYDQALRQILEAHAAKYNKEIGTGTSCFEKHGLGVFGRFPINNTCQGEICHVHTSDHSMHMNLHPEDAKEVLLKGWGQRHPLAWKGYPKMPVPSHFVMVYAPRTKDEIEIVCRIITAAGYWVMCKEYEIDTSVATL